MTSLESAYDRIAKYWHQDHQSDDWWIEGTDTFISYIPHSGSVLDVGCGSGVKSKYFLDRGLQVTGIDISSKLLEIAEKVAPAAQLRHLSMFDLDKISGQFDGVFAQASLLHVPKKDAAKVVKKMADRTVSGGVVYIAVKEGRPGMPEEAIEQEKDYGFVYERFFSYFTMPELEEYFSRAGLKPIYQLRNPSPSGKTVWLQIIGKK